MHASNVIFNLLINVNINLNLMLTLVYITFWESNEIYNLHASSKWGLITGVQIGVWGLIVWPVLQNPTDSRDPGCGNNTSVCCLKAMGSRQCNLWDNALNKSWGNLGSLCSPLWSVCANCFFSSVLYLWCEEFTIQPHKKGKDLFWFACIVPYVIQHSVAWSL